MHLIVERLPTHRIKNIKCLGEGVREFLSLVNSCQDERCEILLGPLVPLKLCVKTETVHAIHCVVATHYGTFSLQQ